MNNNDIEEDTNRIIKEAREIEAKANKYDRLVERIKEKLKEEETHYNKSVNEVYKNPTEALIDFQRAIGKKEVLQDLQELIKEE